MLQDGSRNRHEAGLQDGLPRGNQDLLQTVLRNVLQDRGMRSEQAGLSDLLQRLPIHGLQEGSGNLLERMHLYGLPSGAGAEVPHGMLVREEERLRAAHA